MSLFGNLAGQALGGLMGGGGQGGNQVLQMVMGLVTQGGGVQGIVQKFAAQGMGDIAKQWVAKGPNPPITGEQFTKAFGEQQVSQLAQQMGMQPQQAASGLAALLPSVMDKLTPDGQAVEGSALENNIAGLLKGGTGGLGLGDIGKLFGH